jgi:hypothetical protein
MIKSIVGGNCIEIVGGSSSYPYVNMANTSAGMVRYNGTTSNFEVYDGYNWCPITSLSTTIALDRGTQEILSWAKKKCDEEIELEKLAESYPAVKDLVKQIEEKEAQIKVIQTLVKEENKVGTN